MKSQKKFFLLTFSLYILTLVVVFLVLILNPNDSLGRKQSLEILNGNQRAISYFGSPITKTSFLGSYHSWKTLNGRQYTARFKASGPKNKGEVELEMFKIGDLCFTTKLTLTDQQKKTHSLIDLDTYASCDLTSLNEHFLEYALENIETDPLGFLVISRSENYNDFMQVAVKILPNHDKVFCLEYSEGYRKENNGLYRSKNFYSKHQVIDILKSYVRGTDEHIKEVSWFPLVDCLSTRHSIDQLERIFSKASLATFAFFSQLNFLAWRSDF